MENLLNTRRHEFDWLRVLAFSLLIFYHTGMFFVPWEWHLKDNQISEAFELPMQFMSQWRMSLIFLVSGVGVYYALGYRSGGTFIKDRLKRILLPLLVGMLVVVPPQVYFERLTQGFQGNYFQFFPSIFALEPYPQGNFSWHHLWYLTYVFCYSVLLLPLLLYLRHVQIKETPARVWMFVLFPVLWLSAGAVFLNPRFPGTNALVNDWANHFLYTTAFLFGFLLMKLPQVQGKIKEIRFFSLALASAAFLLLLYFMHDRAYEELTQTQQLLYFVLKTCNRWLWLLTILGMAMTYQHVKGKYLPQANEMVYPFYILHQTVIVALAFYLREQDWPILVKFMLISSGTFGICFALVRYVIMPVNWLRVPFGLAPRKAGAPAPAPVVAEQWSVR